MENKEIILRNALGLFSLRGYDAVGVLEVAESSGVSKPTLYHYFGSKRGLLDFMLQEYFGDFLEEIRGAAAYRGDLPGHLKDLAERFFAFAASNSLFYRMQLSMNFSSPDSEPFEAIQPYNSKLFGYISDMFKAASEDHGNMKGRHMRYAATFIGMLNNYITLEMNGLIKITDTTVYEAVHQFSHGIYS